MALEDAIPAQPRQGAAGQQGWQNCAGQARSHQVQGALLQPHGLGEEVANLCEFSGHSQGAWWALVSVLKGLWKGHCQSEATN